MISYWLPGILMTWGAFLMAVASPGPNVLAVMATSMNDGRRAGVAVALGIAAGSLSWALLSVLGLTALMAAWAPLLVGIKLAGGAWLCWLGLKSLRAAASSTDVIARQLVPVERSMFGYALGGYTIMMTNPKAVLAWIAIVSLGMQANTPVWVAAAIVGGTTVLSALAHVGYAIGFSTPAMGRFYRRARRTLQSVFGIFFLYAGSRLLSER